MNITLLLKSFTVNAIFIMTHNVRSAVPVAVHDPLVHVLNFSAGQERHCGDGCIAFHHTLDNHVQWTCLQKSTKMIGMSSRRSIRRNLPLQYRMDCQYLDTPQALGFGCLTLSYVPTTARNNAKQQLQRGYQLQRNLNATG